MKPHLTATLAILTLTLSLRAADPLPDLVVTNTTTILSLPDDGIIRLNTLRVETNASLRFTTTSLSNPPAILLVTGDVVIDGTVNVNGSTGGRGGPGGFDGGSGWSGGSGPGGATKTTYVSSSYMNSLLIPLIGGSGGFGEGGNSGFGGGGAVLVSSGTSITIRGTITAGGGTGATYAEGGGGAIRLVAPRVAGNGLLTTSQSTSYFHLRPGRIRIDAIDTSAMQFTFVGPVSLGRLMYAFPPNLTNTPTVQITRLLDTPVPTQAGEIVMPVASTQLDGNIEVQTAGFPYVPTVTVAVHPEGLTSTNYTGTPNPAGLAIIPITIPANAITRIQVWAR